MLLYDPTRVEPSGWLSERLGDIVLLRSAEAPDRIAEANTPQVSATPGFIDEATQAELRKIADTVAANGEPPATDPICTDYWGEREDERAAIIEFEAGIPRAWAEAYARLDPNCPIGDISPERWQQYIDDIGRVLDARLMDKAMAFGWGPFDLLGCDRERSVTGIDQRGLCALIGGNRLVELSETAAEIETRSGVRQIYRRKPLTPGRVLPWELVP